MLTHLLFVIAAAICLLTPLIAIHEFGHYWVARRLGVKVLVYSIGFGPTLWRRISPKTGIEYRLSALPFGGYVRMLDEREGTVAPAEQHLAFNRQPVWKRMAIVAAGPLINLVLAVLILWALFLPPSEQLNTRIGRIVPSSPAAVAGLQVGDRITAIDGQGTPTWDQLNYALLDRMGETGTLDVSIERGMQVQHYAVPIQQFVHDQRQSPLQALGFLPYQPPLPPIVGKLTDDGVARQQGLQTGDRIVQINGQPISDWSQVVERVQQSPALPLQMLVQRGQQQHLIQLTPGSRKDVTGQVQGYMGAMVQRQTLQIPPEYRMVVQYTPLQALGMALDKTWGTSKMTLAAIGKMIRGLIGLDSLSGPITIAKVAGQSAELGWEAFFGFMAMMSISLGVLNLLPIPMLDGGHLVYYALEALRGRPVSEQVQLFGLKIGMALLGTMMVLALFNDVMRL